MAKKKPRNTEKIFEKFGTNINQFFGELDAANTRLQEIFKERLEDLKKAGKSLRKEVKNKERWNEAETALRRAAKELKKAATAAFGKAKKAPEKAETKKSPPRKKKTGKPTVKAKAKKTKDQKSHLK